MRPSDAARLTLLAVIWGASFVFIKVALEGFSSLELVAARLVVGALVIAALLRARGGSLPRDARIWRGLMFMAVVSNFIPFLLIAWGEERITASLAAILNSTTPLFTALLAALLLREPLPPLRLAGIGLGFAGVIVIVGIDAAGGELPGELAIIGAALAYGVGFVYASRRLPSSAGSPLSKAAGQLLAAAAFSLPFAGVEAAATPPSAPGLLPLACALALGVFGTGVAYVLYYRLIHDIGPTSASFVVYLVPVFAIALGYLTLDEKLGLNTFVGAALVIGGIALAEHAKGKHARRAQPESLTSGIR